MLLVALKNMEKIKVLFDHQIFAQEVGGISRYFYNLINTLKKQGRISVKLSVSINKNLYFKKIGIIKLRFRGSSFCRSVLNRKPFRIILQIINEYYTIYNLRIAKYDLLHVTNEDLSYLLDYKIDIPIIITIHDLIPELYPDYFPDIKIRLKKRAQAISRVNHFIAISETTKNDLISQYRVNPQNISVIYHGSPSLKNTNTLYVRPVPIDINYILYVGDRNAKYKNFFNLLDHISLILNKNLKLVCIGTKFTSMELEIAEKLNLNNKIISIYASDDHLISIYRDAKCLIYPSIYEGFGLPLLEAMSAKCPVLCSNTPSLVEIAGDAAQYFDPFTFAGFHEGIMNIINDQSYRKDLILKGILRKEKFSWDNSAKKTENAYFKTIKTFRKG